MPPDPSPLRRLQCSLSPPRCLSGRAWNPSQGYDLSEHRLSKLYSQGTLGDDIYFSLEFLFQKQSQPHQIKQVRPFFKVHQHINITDVTLLLPHKGAEEPYLLRLVSCRDL